MESDVPDYLSHKVLPLISNGMQTLKERDKESFLYAYGQAGISVHFAKNGSELLMGAPGIYNWKGSVVRLADSEGFSPSPNVRRRRAVEPPLDLSVYRVPNPYLTAAVHENDYFGYSVSSGEFLGDGQTYYVAGAPRAALGNGKVFVFDFPPNELEGIGVVLERVGSQVGSYFGAAVLGMDVTGDGRPELLVGAPLHSQGSGAGAPAGLEEGRVCVYQNLGRGQLSEQPLVLAGSRAPRARFGSAVASVGDLDQDGYNDIAIGAPYEDDQRGAIYIYLGGAGGLSPTYSQRIGAAELSGELRGFGVSLSHGLDMDNNRYSDVAVGSYLSGEAVLLRAQPVVRFHAHLSSSTDRLQPTDRQFRITACIKYFGKHLPEQLPTEVLMKIESRHVLCAFDLSGGSRDNFTYTRMLTYESYSCDDFTVLIKSDIHDYTQPIQLSMSYNISSEDGTVEEHSRPSTPVTIGTDLSKRAERSKRQVSSLMTGDLSEFCATCPVVNRLGAGQTQVRLSVPFSIGCGADAVCQSDLSVSAAVSGLREGAAFVIGASPTIELDVNVTNAGEPASLPSVQVKLPPPIRLVRVPQLCSERETSEHVVLTCHIRPHPFPAGAEGRIRLSLDVQELAPGTESLTVQLNVTSAGEELAAADNVRNFRLDLRTEADIAVTGWVVPAGVGQK
ncbi:Integrin alpha-4 [Amphibalanus amphitrite]|uniref:Integrin alpha-4 n=1 Tax=Amphibalanus amphitrite TaxID=1232801 RepID=A0A6A4VYA7_AMPAM|nr:Integrin alpha-4 [Amphibalanus amphitrite]